MAVSGQAVQVCGGFKQLHASAPTYVKPPTAPIPSEATSMAADDLKVSTPLQWLESMSSQSSNRPSREELSGDKIQCLSKPGVSEPECHDTSDHTKGLSFEGAKATVGGGACHDGFKTRSTGTDRNWDCGCAASCVLYIGLLTTALWP